MFETSACLAPLEEAVDRTKILIVDDDDDQSSALSYRLNKYGFATLTADTVERGVRQSRDKSPDLILLDVRLPDGSGLDLCRILADDPHTWSIPIIIVSGMESQSVVRNARTAGARFFLKKPYDPNALLVLIENALREEF
ncbi:response regulator [Lignipirellula cremea]|uniref:KDP operon transcriptional regulatory protein KdpE n=1 Tax=Lignipirellula cremea TaxID=2528010 RepID=A0A518DP10_9BACT|nr:response regulator [Lignipirellula cremea]QDU93543.1 KDP operon transcriptional regulatory protein KdpE [Lignipirellula cremea]